MRRGESIFELDLNAHDEVDRGFELEGSNLSGVSARCSWAEQDHNKLDIINFKDEHIEEIRLKPSFPPSFNSGNNECICFYYLLLFVNFFQGVEVC